MAAVDTTRYNELCRLCATKTNLILAVHIFHNDGIIGHLSKKIENCLSIHVHEGDHLPKMVCENCLYKLNLFSDFKERTLRTERLLVDLFKELHDTKIVSSIPMEHDMILIHNQQLMQNQMHEVDEIDLAHLTSREEMIVGLGHQIILAHHHQPVDMNGHSLDNINLNHHHHQELTTHQDLSNHSLQTQDSILVETSNDIDNPRFANDNLDLIQHQHLLSEQFRLQHDLHANITAGNGVNDMDLHAGLASSINLKLESQNNTHGYAIHSEKDLDFEPNPTKLNDISNHSTASNEVSPPEDSNSNNSLLIDDNLRSQDTKPYMIQTDDSNTVNSTALSNETNSDWLYCNMCGEACQNESSFQTHYESHFEKCDICFAMFANKETLNAHKNEVHADVKDVKPVKTRLKRATLPINDGDSNSEDSDKDPDDPLEVNASEESGNKNKKTAHPRVCKECGKSYKTNYKLNEHMRRHTGEKPYKCTECDKEFRSKIGLAQHAAKHTGKYDYSCPTCNKGFQCKSYLMVHQRVHSDVKPYPCTTCGRNFKTKQSLLDHTNRHLGVKPYMCEICGRGFITKGLCKAHLKVHTGLDNRKFSCKVCQKMFVSKSYLQTHLRIHTGEKPFICEVCGKGFLTKVDLRIHTTMHTGEKSYVCEICGKAFARRDALRCHRRSHTGERPYSCDRCGQTFTQFTPMAIHKRLHTGERPYACESCGKTFISRSTMMSHAKKHNR